MGLLTVYKVVNGVTKQGKRAVFLSSEKGHGELGTQTSEKGVSVCWS